MIDSDSTDKSMVNKKDPRSFSVLKLASDALKPQVIKEKT